MTPQSRRRLIVNGTFVFTVALLFWGISLLMKSRQPKVSKAPAYVAKGDSLFPIRILVDLSPEDFGIEESGNMGGLQVKLAERLFKDMVIRWIPTTDQSAAIDQLLKGEADIYANFFALPRKQELEAQGLSMSRPLFNNSLVLIRHSSAISPMDPSVADSTLMIAVTSDDLSAQMVLANIIELAYPNLAEDVVDSNELDLTLNVVKGVNKYAVINRELATEMVTRYPNDIQIVQDISFDTRQTWLVQPGDSAVLHLLNDKIANNLDRK